MNRLLQELEELAEMEEEGHEYDDVGANTYDFFDWGEAALVLWQP